MILHLRDLRERRSLEADVHAAEERFREAFFKAPTGIALSGLDGRILEANRSFADIVGREPEHLVGLSFADFTHPDDLEANLRYSRRLRDGELTSYRMEKRYLRPDGTTVWAVVNVSVLAGPDGQPRHHLAHIEDITARKSLTETLAHQAHHDSLTGLPNRAAVHRRVDQALARRHRHDVGVLFVDLDDFKVVNDDFGHEVGDGVLAVVARRLADAVRPGDLVGRVGGDEFVVVCEPATAEVLDTMAHRLRAAVEPTISVADDPAMLVGASVGTALAELADDAASLLRRADDAMYAEKTDRRRSR